MVGRTALPPPDALTFPTGAIWDVLFKGAADKKW